MPVTGRWLRRNRRWKVLFMGLVIGVLASWSLDQIPWQGKTVLCDRAWGIEKETQEKDALETRDGILVSKVIDGDTIIVEGDEAVRLRGVDTPEKNEPFYAKAKAFLRKAVHGRQVRLSICKEEPRDRYGRLLASVETSDMDMAVELLRSGLARTLIINPCVASRVRDYQRTERAAFRAGKGIWSLQEPRRIPHDQARPYVGWMMTVTGKVRNVHQGQKAIHLNFGPDYRTDFTAVIFLKDLPRLSGQGLLLPVTDYRGQHVEVTGTIKEYNGPEILIHSADQLVL